MSEDCWGDTTDVSCTQCACVWPSQTPYSLYSNLKTMAGLSHTVTSRSFNVKPACFCMFVP